MLGENIDMDPIPEFCSTPDCSYSIDPGAISCTPGGDNCTGAILLSAKESAFFTSPIKDVTELINKEIEKLAKHPPKPGQQLSFLWSPSGVMLAWTTHVEVASETGVKRSDGREANDRALGIGMDSPEQAA
jgi:hypothetical protein